MQHQQQDLAALLTELKERSGLSYSWIGRKINASKSAVHRYCSGQAVPQDFGTVERIARACGADRAELDRLYSLWTAAVREAAETAVPGSPTAAHTPPAATDLSGESGASGLSVALPPVEPLPATVRTSDLPSPVPAATSVSPPASPPDSTGALPAVAAALPAATGASAAPPSMPPPAAAPGSAAGSPGLGRLLRAGLASRRLSWRATALAGVLVVLAAAAVVAVLARSPATPSNPNPSSAPQWISGPTWTLPAAPVRNTFFGVTINTPTGHMPSFHVGAVRLWDSETRWSQIEPERGVFDWSTLDRLVTGAERAGLPVLFVAGGTPKWAAPNARRSVYPEDARTAPPDDLADWDTFVRALTQRYRGRIESYELWAFANDARLYSGSTETLVEMTRRASAIIRAADPLATVVCPGMGNLWSAEAQQALRRFAQLGGYDHCDVAGIKLHQRNSEDPPETMLELADQVDRILREAGVHPPLWNTGTTYSIPLQAPLDDARARDYAVRFFLVGMIARKANLERMYFYSWGASKLPIVLQPDGADPTSAGRAVERLQRGLAAAEITACGHGPAVNLPVHAWQCEFTVDTPDGRRRALIRWVHTGTATIRADSGAVAVDHLDGRTEAVTAGSAVVLTEEPIMMRFTT